MRLPRALLIAALLASGASGCNNPPAPQVASHPPAEDLRCAAEPDGLTDQQVLADPEGKAEDKFNDDVLIAGRSCRDALRRACQWHVDRGAKDLDCSAIRPQASSSGRTSRAVAALVGYGDPSLRPTDGGALSAF